MKRKKLKRVWNKLCDAGETVLAIVFWDGVTKPPRKDRRNGL